MEISQSVELLKNHLIGRTDAYGLDTPEGAQAIREPLTDSIIVDHIKGFKRIGSYPVLNDNKVKWAVIDIDEVDELKNPDTRKARENAVKVYVSLVENNLFPYLEISRSKGFHLWLFFDDAIPAKIVRKVLKRILKNLGFDYEVFPKQDSVDPNNGVGNFVYLPLNGKLAKIGKCLFLNSNFEPYPDQWEHLSKIHQTKSENVSSLAEEIQEEAKPIQERGDSTPEDSLDVSKYLIHYNIPFKIKKDTDRTFYLLNRCLFFDNHTTKDNLGDSAIVQSTSGKITYQCFHGHCKGRTWADARKAISGSDSLAQFRKDYTPPITLLKRGEGKSLSEILSQPEASENYLVKPLLSRGDKGFVVSSYKMGKTLFLTQLTLCISMGIPFLGFEIPEPAKVLYIRFELKDLRFRKRLQSMVNGLGGIRSIKVEPIFELVRGFNINDKKDFEWLLGLIEKHRAEVLLLDPLYKIATIDLKDTANAMPLIRKFDSIIEAYPQLLLITAHHLRKQTGDEKDSWDSTYGPMFFFADMDFELRIKAKHRENPEFTLEHISNDVPVDSFTFKRNPETLLYYVSHPESDHLDEILDYVNQNKPTKTVLKDWMIGSLGLSRRQALTCIDRMIGENSILYEGKTTRGHLTIPEANLDLIRTSTTGTNERLV